MKYPKIGETFYWKDLEGNIVEDICYDIREKDNPDIETMFYTYLSPKGGGYFVTESDVIDKDSPELEKFKLEKLNEKLKLTSDYISNKEIYKVLIERLTKKYDFFEAVDILNLLMNK